MNTTRKKTDLFSVYVIIKNNVDDDNFAKKNEEEAAALMYSTYTKLLSISFNSGTLIKLDNLIMSKTTYITTVL